MCACACAFALRTLSANAVVLRFGSSLSDVRLRDENAEAKRLAENVRLGVCVCD